MRSWQMQEAKARLAELIRRAEEEGPQRVTVRGREAVVVLSQSDYDRLTKPSVTFLELMRSSPLVGVELHLRRDKSPARDVDL